MKNVINRIKSLPVSTKRLLGLGTVLGLFVALPLFIWAIVTQTFLFKQKAASGEPVPLPTPTNNSVNWVTPYAKLSASNFYINVDGNKLFVGSNVSVRSDPGDDTYTDLELSWRENNVDMGMTFYFSMTNGVWKVTEVRTGDGNSPGTTLSYIGFNGNSKGSPFTANNFNLISTDGRGFVHFENLNLQAFLPLNLPVSPAGYILEPKPLTDAIRMSYVAGNGSGYGVNVVLRNSDFSVVTDQSNVNYQWTTTNSNVVTVQSSNLAMANQTCSYGINFPCPNNHGDITAKGIGTATINVSAINKTTGGVLATAKFKVIVGGPTTPTPVATCIPRPSCLDSIPRCMIAEPAEGWCTKTPTPRPTIRPPAGECQLCGGIAGIRCALGLTCKMTKPTHPDQSGICVKTNGTSFCAPTPTPTLAPSISPSASPFPTFTPSASSSPLPSVAPLTGDVNGDGLVNIVDIGIIVDNYRLSPPNYPAADLNHDGLVNIIDIGIVVDHYQN